MLVDRDAGLAAVLGQVHRDVGVAQQLFPAAVVVGDGQADAGAHAVPAAVDDDRFGQRDLQPFGDRPTVAQVAVLHQDRELVAAQPGRGVLRPQHVHQPLGDVDEHPVADPVADAVVDLLEVVEVEEQHHHVVLAAPGPTLHRVLEPVGEQATVGEPGEGVVERVMGQLLLHLQARRHIASGQDESVHTVVAEQVGERSFEEDGGAVAVPGLHGHRRVALPGESGDEGRYLLRLHDLVDPTPAEQVRRVPAQDGLRGGGDEADARVGVEHGDHVAGVVHQRGEAPLTRRPGLVLGDLPLQVLVPRDESAEPEHPAQRRDHEQADIDEGSLYVDPVRPGRPGATTAPRWPCAAPRAEVSVRRGRAAPRPARRPTRMPAGGRGRCVPRRARPVPAARARWRRVGRRQLLGADAVAAVVHGEQQHEFGTHHDQHEADRRHHAEQTGALDVGPSRHRARLHP